MSSEYCEKSGRPSLLELLLRKLPYPKTAMIDPANICQLRCPLCSTGRKTLNYEQQAMPLDLFKLLLDKMPFVKKLELFKNGEPFLNRDILEMTRYAGSRGIEVSISTNFSLEKPPEFFNELVRSGLTKLVVSLDGASRESYSQYRMGGDFACVMSNIRALVEAKERLQSRTPEIVWQFLVNRFNEGEIPTALQMSRDLKIRLDLQPMGLADDLPDVRMEGTIEERKSFWLPKDGRYVAECYKNDYRPPLFRGICEQLFTRVVVAADGKVLPCCWAEDRNSVFGDLGTQSFDEIWHGEKYLLSRMMFFGKPGAGTVCSSCNNFSTSPSLREKVNLVSAILRQRWTQAQSHRKEE